MRARIRTPLRTAALAALLAPCAWAHALADAPATAPASAGYSVIDSGAREEVLRFTGTDFGSAQALRVRVLPPPGYDAKAQPGYATLYLNDGQDAEAVALRAWLDALIVSGEIRPVIAVAIDMAPQRHAAYGFSDRAGGRSLPAPSSIGAIGGDAHAYSEWLAKTLIPAIDARYNTRARPDARALLGWSLGGAHAFNFGWQYPELVARTGAFSPSLWLAADNTDAAAVQRTRIAQSMANAGQYRAGSRWFFAVGDSEETDDRDGDGVHDVLDDTRELIDGWRVAGNTDPQAKGLRQLGHSVALDFAPGATGAAARADAQLYVLPGGEHRQASWSRMLPVFLRWAFAPRAPALSATGRVDGWQDVPSRHVAARNVDVWLPPSYGRDPQRRYPVLYMHDGQNLFDPGLAYTGTDWDVDGAMTRLIAAGQVREAIVVGVWNTPLRFFEYMPRAPLTTAKIPSGIDGRADLDTAAVVSDAYLRFLVEELKPFIDAQYRTLPGRDDTLVMGSSMGGLISLYAGARHPQVFGRIGAVSTHWPICEGCTIGWFKRHLPAAGTHRIYYDFGTATLDAYYPPYQAKMDAAMKARGYRQGRDWLTRRFEGAEHNEAAWKARLEIPLVFLLGTDTTSTASAH